MQNLIFALIFTVGIFGALATITIANSPDDITFPVAELGNCADKADCHAYCDNIANADQCMAFAEQHGLLSADEAHRARGFRQLREGISGPGGCSSHRECRTYCENIENLQECLSFAEQHEMMDPEEIEEARGISRAIQQGAQMPGGCTSRQECMAYCSLPGNTEECLSFAAAAGLMPPEEIERARTMMSLMTEGRTPGGCTSKRECMDYCFENEDNIDECSAFWLEAGFITQQEAEMMRETGGRGPGGCRAEECDAYCNDPANQQECFEFAKEHNLLSEDRQHAMQGHVEEMSATFENAPPEVRTCIADALGGSDALARLESGDLMPGPEIGEQIQACMERFMQHAPPSAIEEPDGLREVPPHVRACDEAELGFDLMERMRTGDIDHAEFQQILDTCAAKHHEMQEEPYEPQYMEQQPPPMPQPLPEFSDPCQAELRELEERMRAGEIDPSEMRERMERCMQRTREMIQHSHEEFNDMNEFHSTDEQAYIKNNWLLANIHHIIKQLLSPQWR